MVEKKLQDAARRKAVCDMVSSSSQLALLAILDSSCFFRS